MIVSIAVDDGAWDAVPALEELAARAVDVTAAVMGITQENLEVAFLFTDDEAMAALNAKWRGQAHATNVLSFPAKKVIPPGGEAVALGDIVLAAGVVAREALEQGKTLPHHATHLMVHGLLHLLDHDHETDKDASAMENLETEILKGLGISDPYDRR